MFKKSFFERGLEAGRSGENPNADKVFELQHGRKNELNSPNYFDFIRGFRAGLVQAREGSL